MDHFIRKENISHFRRLLADPHVANDPVLHQLLLKLLAEEIYKEKLAAGWIDPPI